jgi:uncharacterized protein YoxC
MNHETLELVFVGIAAVALATQAFILLAVFLGVSKAVKSAKDDIADMKSSVMPVVETARELLVRAGKLAPKVESTVTDISDLTHLVRVQADDVSASVEEILGRVRNQASRVDGMFTGTLDAVDKASEFVSRAVSKPIRQISGVLASIKAFVETLQEPLPPANAFHEHDTQDDIQDDHQDAHKDMFV